MSRAHVYLVLATACWGVGTVISKSALEDLRPLPLLAIQLGVSVTFLAVASWRLATPRAPDRRSRRAAALGLLNPGLSYALALVGLSTIAASTSVLIWASEPAVIVLLAFIFLRERLTHRSAGALAMALAGVILVVYSGSVSGSAVGVILTAAAVLACAVYTVLARVWAVDEAALAITLNQQVAALLFALALVCAAEMARAGGTPQMPLVDVSAASWAAAVVSGLMYYALAFWFYLTALRSVSASVAGSFITLVPVFGVAAALMTGEALSIRQWLGAVLVVGSVAVIATARSEASRIEPASH